jgi:hypothetical protein
MAGAPDGRSATEAEADENTLLNLKHLQTCGKRLRVDKSVYFFHKGVQRTTKALKSSPQ